MPRHLIGDAHEWINEIPTVPTHSLAKLQPSQRSWDSTCVSYIMCHKTYIIRFDIKSIRQDYILYTTVSYRLIR